MRACAVHVLLQLVEKIMDCSRAGKLQEVVAEKRSVLTSMQQVLQSCYALLDSTQVPLHSIIRLLQHILRCVGRLLWLSAGQFMLSLCCLHITAAIRHRWAGGYMSLDVWKCIHKASSALTCIHVCRYACPWFHMPPQAGMRVMI
jgi:uncharacterized protein (UPF0248 family)